VSIECTFIGIDRRADLYSCMSGLFRYIACACCVVSLQLNSQEPLTPALCDQATAQDLTFEGDWFIKWSCAAMSGQQTQAEVLLSSGGQRAVSSRLEQCGASVRIDASHCYERCARSVVSVQSSVIGASPTFSIRHTHPATLSACTITAQATFAVIPAPRADSALPMSICLGGANSNITVSGLFGVINGVPPVIRIGTFVCMCVVCCENK
jgi:hypothetical protein